MSWKLSPHLASLVNRLKAKNVLIFASFLFLVVTLFLYWADSYISNISSSYCFDSIEAVPHCKVALVLGTSPTLSNGKANSYYRLRIEAAEKLFKSNRVDYLLISGDNSRKEYDEPSAMKNDLMSRGVPESKIYRDYAGFRTLDSVVRANAIFGLEEFVVVSQRFHNERAVFLALSRGLKPTAYNADLPLDWGQGYFQWFREKLARGMAILDIFLLNKQPKFFGEKIEIGVSPPN